VVCIRYCRIQKIRFRTQSQGSIQMAQGARLKEEKESEQFPFHTPYALSLHPNTGSSLGYNLIL